MASQCTPGQGDVFKLLILSDPTFEMLKNGKI